METTNFTVFDNQISGHSCLLKGTTNPQYIYKPYDCNEAEFYESFSKKQDHPLSDFIPTYYGVFHMPKPMLEEFVVNVSREESSSYENDEHSQDVDLNNNSHESLETTETDSPNAQSRSEWLKNLLITRLNDSDTRFLKLKDLTSDLETPCMLDLKMGSVAYNVKKIAHQAAKFGQTTSSSLKFRVCGLQVKNPKSETEYFRDKYWGRRLKQDHMLGALSLFFFDGHSIRRNLIRQFLRLLVDLAEAIKASVGFNFYSVSLLLIYDSSHDDEEFIDNEYTEVFLKNKLQLKLIDFAKSTYKQHSNEPDTDLLTGVENLIRCLTEIQENMEIKPCSL